MKNGEESVGEWVRGMYESLEILGKGNQHPGSGRAGHIEHLI